MDFTADCADRDIGTRSAHCHMTDGGVTAWDRVKRTLPVLIASGHDVTSTYIYLSASRLLLTGAFCATYFGGERLAPCRAAVSCMYCD